MVRYTLNLINHKTPVKIKAMLGSSVDFYGKLIWQFLFSTVLSTMLNIIFFGFKLKSMTMTTIIAGPWKIYCWWGFLSAVGQRVLVSFSFSSREDLALPKRLSRDLSLKLKIFISSQFSNLFEISFFLISLVLGAHLLWISVAPDAN